MFQVVSRGKNQLIIWYFAPSKAEETYRQNICQLHLCSVWNIFHKKKSGKIYNSKHLRQFKTFETIFSILASQQIMGLGQFALATFWCPLSESRTNETLAPTLKYHMVPRKGFRIQSTSHQDATLTLSLLATLGILVILFHAPFWPLSTSWYGPHHTFFLPDWEL